MANPQSRLLVIGLDGFDWTLAEKFLQEGLLPNLARLHNRSARYELDHGRDKFSGLAWEHFSTGKAPSDGGRWSAVTFDPKTYSVRQEMTSARPFVADLSSRTVVFDLPYCDLSHAPKTQGVANWGAHDPGVEAGSRPAGVYQELLARFGSYPAPEWLYGFCWPSVERTRASSEALAHAVNVRARAARWLLGERLPDWDLGIVVVSEGHSAIEPLFHGVDPHHPLHTIESAPVAAAGLRKVYAAIDHLVGDLIEAFPGITVVALAMHGMGPNESDVPAMALLPEFLYRSSFGSPYMLPLEYSQALPNGTPLLPPEGFWDSFMLRAAPRPARSNSFSNRLKAKLSRFAGRDVVSTETSGIEWMPATRYGSFWPRMCSFALPAFYDGRIRINVAAREAQGIVSRQDYTALCERTTELLHQCTNLLTGKKAVAEIQCPKQDPFSVDESEADLYVIWESEVLGLSHPQLGSIGPIPYRRTGGHTGGLGFLFVAGDGVSPGDRGRASSFDAVPTILDLLGESQVRSVSGHSLAPGLFAEDEKLQNYSRRCSASPPGAA